jgi:hypothetical protein
VPRNPRLPCRGAGGLRFGDVIDGIDGCVIKVNCIVAGIMRLVT